jgi:uncharacterized protein
MTGVLEARAAAPIAPPERVVALDVMRGFAVFGILLMNIVPLSGAWMFNLGDRTTLPGAWLDPASEFFLEFFAHAKFYSLFSLLFGVGFAIFLDRATARGVDPSRLFRRRLTGLLIIGLVHSILIWFGDILNVYALLGFLLLPFRNRSDRQVLKWAGIVWAGPIAIYIVALAITVALGIKAPPAGAGEALPPFLAEAVRAFASGGYLAVVKGNIVFTIAGWVRRIVTLFILRMFSMFLLGLWAARVGVFRHPERHEALLRHACAWGLILGGPASAIGAWMGDPGVAFIPNVNGLIWTILQSIGSTGLCVFYAAGLTLLCQKPAWLARLRPLASVGSCALSNYLLQSILSIIIFYGLGFGLFSHVSIVVSLVIAVAIYAFQIVLTRVWLARAQYGPAEWLWRRFTYGRWAPLWREAV